MCSGWLNPGPVEIGPNMKWIPQTRDMEVRSRALSGQNVRIDRDIDIEAQFIEACWRNDIDAVTAALVANLVDVNTAYDEDSRNRMKALHIAAAIGSETLARMLVTRGASVYVLDNENRTPLHILGTIY